MAEKTPTVEELQAQLAEKEAEVQALRNKSKKKNDFTGKPIPGTVPVELETPEGKKVKRKLKFQPGFVNARLPNGEIVSSEALMKVAAGKSLTKEEAKYSPALIPMSKEQAAELFHTWARKQVSFLVDA